MSSTKDFSESELRCKCGKCSGGIMDAGFMEKLQLLRDLYRAPIIITSAYRCNNHNMAVKGSPSSQHLYGRAVDIHCHDALARYRLLALAIQVGFTGIGIDKTFIHVDLRLSERKIWVY